MTLMKVILGLKGCRCLESGSCEEDNLFHVLLALKNVNEALTTFQDATEKNSFACCQDSESFQECNGLKKKFFRISMKDMIF